MGTGHGHRRGTRCLRSGRHPGLEPAPVPRHPAAMTDTPSRRLLDLPGLDALERAALMQPRLADPDERHDHPQVDDATAPPSA